MTKVSDLNLLGNKPATMEEWLSRFTEEDRKIVTEAIVTQSPSKIHPILRDLDDNPCPFSAAALSGWRRRAHG